MFRSPNESASWKSLYALLDSRFFQLNTAIREILTGLSETGNLDRNMARLLIGWLN